ncbi:MAG: hypothetical protein KAR06_04385 [Deltaproteobacteria bacterium]|nr:hypothetical protein [Deltaproteobacteria bacterium]
MIIDKKKEAHKHIPASLDGMVLLEETKDENGKTTGFHAIEPGYLKHYAETKTDEELKTLGYEKFMDKVAFVKARPNIMAKVPPTKGNE